MLAIILPKEIETRLDSLSKATGRSKSYYVREALVEYLDDLEDIYLAEKGLEEIRAGRSKTVPLDEVMKRYRKSFLDSVENGITDVESGRTQTTYFAKACGVSRFAYNWALAEWDKSERTATLWTSSPKYYLTLYQITCIMYLCMIHINTRYG